VPNLALKALLRTEGELGDTADLAEKDAAEFLSRLIETADDELLV
jgi:hypothetical protein